MFEQLRNALIEALEDEYRAEATYRLILDKFGSVRPFANIVESEGQHIRALLLLFQKYGIPIPENDWQQQVVVPDSIQAACEAGVQAEIKNAEMYQRLLTSIADYPDVKQVFLNLQRASQSNHLPAFQRCTTLSSPIKIAGNSRVVNAPPNPAHLIVENDNIPPKAGNELAAIPYQQNSGQMIFQLLGLGLVVTGVLVGLKYWGVVAANRRHRDQRQTQQAQTLRAFIAQRVSEDPISLPKPCLNHLNVH
ncbi:ferritin-like domain-containing protein [Phormidium nigroviride]